jgi:small basic protein
MEQVILGIVIGGAVATCVGLVWHKAIAIKCQAALTAVHQKIKAITLATETEKETIISGLIFDAKSFLSKN